MTKSTPNLISLGIVPLWLQLWDIDIYVFSWPKKSLWSMFIYMYIRRSIQDHNWDLYSYDAVTTSSVDARWSSHNDLCWWFTAGRRNAALLFTRPTLVCCKSIHEKLGHESASVSCSGVLYLRTWMCIFTYACLFNSARASASITKATETHSLHNEIMKEFKITRGFLWCHSFTWRDTC